MARKVGRQVMKAKWMILTVLCVIFRVSLVFAQKEFQVEQHQDTKSNGNQGKQSEQTALRKHIVAKDGAEMVLIPAGEFEMGSNNLHRRVVGQKLEILLLQNPYQLSPGNALEVQVLFDGKPLDDHLVTALNGDVKRRIFGKQRQTGATGPLYYKECEIIYGQVLICKEVLTKPVRIVQQVAHPELALEIALERPPGCCQLSL